MSLAQGSQGETGMYRWRKKLKKTGGGGKEDKSKVEGMGGKWFLFARRRKKEMLNGVVGKG